MLETRRDVERDLTLCALEKHETNGSVSFLSHRRKLLPLIKCHLLVLTRAIDIFKNQCREMYFIVSYTNYLSILIIAHL